MTTGLLAVVFSMITVLNMVNGAILFGQKIEGRVALAAAFGLDRPRADLLVGHRRARDQCERILTGLGLSLLGTLSASFGNMASIGLGQRGSAWSNPTPSA